MLFSSEEKSKNPPMFLCFKVGKPMRKSFATGMTFSPAHSLGGRGKQPEYWFAVPQERWENDTVWMKMMNINALNNFFLFVFCVCVSGWTIYMHFLCSGLQMSMVRRLGSRALSLWRRRSWTWSITSSVIPHLVAGRWDVCVSAVLMTDATVSRADDIFIPQYWLISTLSLPLDHYHRWGEASAEFQQPRWRSVGGHTAHPHWQQWPAAGHTHREGNQIKMTRLLATNDELCSRILIILS